MISKIVCATRGGEASRVIQQKAIDLAKETNQSLAFLYVVNIKALGEMDAVYTDVAKSELEWFGNAILEIARQRALDDRVQANIAIRHGLIQDEIEAFLRESHAEILVIGETRTCTSNQTFANASQNVFIDHIKKHTGVDVVLVPA